MIVVAKFDGRAIAAPPVLNSASATRNSLLVPTSYMAAAAAAPAQRVVHHHVLLAVRANIASLVVFTAMTRQRKSVTAYRYQGSSSLGACVLSLAQTDSR